MAGGTHVFDMIKILRNNENLRRLSYFKTRKLYDNAFRKGKVDLKTASKEQLLRIRNEVRIERQRDLRRGLLVFLISLVAVLLVFLLLWKYLRF